MCPSDNSISGHSNPWTSYVANTGLLDNAQANTATGGDPPYLIAIGTPNWSGNPVPLESSANGVFQDQVLGAKLASTATPQNFTLQVTAKVLPSDFKDGHTATLLISENIDAHYYSAYDDWSSAPTYSIPFLPVLQSQWQNTLATSNTSWGDSWERGAGFVWWIHRQVEIPIRHRPHQQIHRLLTTNCIPSLVLTVARVIMIQELSDGQAVLVIQLTRQVVPPTIPTANSNYAARPASSHPGGVIVAFAGGNTRFVRDDIDYKIYCLLMTPNGANATTMSYTMPSGFTTTNVTFRPPKAGRSSVP